MWRALVAAVRLRRAMWVQGVQPGLVADDPLVAIVRIGMVLVGVVILDWSSVTDFFAVLILVHMGVLLGLSIIRYYYSRYHPVQYGHWRWLLILALNLTLISMHGNYTYLFASPSQTIWSYLKNLLFASGILFSVQDALLQREMFYMTCPCQGMVVGVLCYNAEKVCRRGLLATDYGTQATRTMFQYVGRTFNITATVVQPFECDPHFAIPGPSDPTKDLPACVCLIHILLVSFCFLLPNILCYLREDKVILLGLQLRAWPVDQPHAGQHHPQHSVDQSEDGQTQQHQQQPPGKSDKAGELKHQSTASPYTPSEGAQQQQQQQQQAAFVQNLANLGFVEEERIYWLLTAFGMTLLMGLLVWATLRWYHGV